MVELEVKDRGPTFEIATNANIEEMGINIKDMLPAMFGSRSRKRSMRVGDALDYLVQEEEQKLIDMDQVTRIALDRVRSNGIIFLDEIDKIAGREGGHGPDVSREGVQRDILPIVEGTTVNTRHGFVRTDHILFIAAGAFHVSKPSDLIPELQGRFPIRVELKSLTVDDFVRILKEPKNALAKQYVALMETEGIKLNLTEDALEEVAKFAAQVNESAENIGARRLHTIMEKLLEEISFEGPDLRKKNVKVDAAYVPEATRRYRERSGSEPLHFVRAWRLHWIALAGLLSGCGYPGEPLPPALKRPTRVADLAVVERGSKVYIQFTVPALTTEGLPVTKPDIELRMGPMPAEGFSAWEKTAERIPQAAIQIDGSHAIVQVDASKFYNKTVVIAVRVHGPHGVDVGWSRPELLELILALPVPEGLVATDAPDAVRLDWHAAAPEFRILRKAADETAFRQIGTSDKPSYPDPTIEYGKTYDYLVQSIEKSGEHYAESEPSTTITFKPD